MSDNKLVIYSIFIILSAYYKERKNCEKCGNECTGNVCSVCTMILKLKANQT